MAEEENVLEISIPGSRTIQNKYTEYEVICITNNKGFEKCYTRAFRRYSDFHRLHSRLKCLIDVLPEFPRKKWNKLSRQVVEERMRMFTIYMRFVCDYILKSKDGEDKVSMNVMDFLQDDSRMDIN